MAPGQPALVPALPCPAVCAIRPLHFHSRSDASYAFLVFDSQGNVQCEQSSLPLEAAISGRDGTIFSAKFGAASCRRIGQSGSPHALLCLCLCRGQCPIGQCWRRRARARRRLGLQSVFKCVVCVVHAFWAFRALWVYLVVSCVRSRAVGDRVMQFVIYSFKSDVLQKSRGLSMSWR